MAVKYVYEQDYLTAGWPDEGGGSLTSWSWFDRDVTDDHLIILYALEAPYLASDLDSFFVTLPLDVEVVAGRFVDNDVFYRPSGVRALNQPAQLLRNEVRRVR